jgi:DNA polymerase (family X)
MTSKDLAGWLEYAADLMDVLGEGEFRSKAYRTAARGLEQSLKPLEELSELGFKGVSGVGAGLAPMLVEIVQSGEFGYLAELESRIPEGVIDLFGVQGLGPKRIRALWDNGIDSLEALLEGAETGKIRSLPGFGAKSEASLQEAARYALDNRTRVMLPVALKAAQLVLGDLKDFRCEVAGSTRRGLETVGNLDVVVVGEPARIAQVLGKHAQQIQENMVLGSVEGLPLRVICTTEENFGTVLLGATGSRAWLEGLGSIDHYPYPDEDAVFSGLKMSYVPAYWREEEHLNLAVLPPIKPEQVKGLIHCHSSYSDGGSSLKEMAEAALAYGFSYMAICDHSQTAIYAGGLKPADLKRQWAEIESLNTELAPFRILRGIESDILVDGSLDYPEEILAQFDVVVGSIHANLGLGKAEQTQRLIRALENPYLSILGHPSARIVLRRKGIEADWEAVLACAAKHHKTIEFNCSPYRLDLDWRLMLQWRDQLNFSLGPDSHSTAGIAEIQYGVLFANKAGLAAGQVINTWAPEQVMALKQGTSRQYLVP